MARLPGRPNVVLGADYGPDVDLSRWVVIYPPYLDSTRTEKQVCDPDTLCTYQFRMQVYIQEVSKSRAGNFVISNEIIQIALCQLWKCVGPENWKGEVCRKTEYR